MTSEIVILITELRNKQRITLPAGSYRFGRSAQCEYVLRRNNVGDHQFTVGFADGKAYIFSYTISIPVLYPIAKRINPQTKNPYINQKI